jgi:S-adenosylmethionine:tRNA ribosyltransferase-isomerase
MTALALEPDTDAVRLMVSDGDRLIHTDFDSLPTHLRAGDLLIANASATIPAALPARREDGTAVDLHLSTPHQEGHVVEVRRNGRRFKAQAETLTLPAGGRATLLAPYLSPDRLWIAHLELPEPLLPYLYRHGAPIRYGTPERPLSDYQTIFATQPGSAEMPSAARPFTQATLRALRARGVSVQRITLHTGVSSQERGERPYPERYEVSAHTARRINERAGRVIAIGTTVVRALETVADEAGVVHAGSGWTNLMITPGRRIRVVDGLVTGWHDPDASHLLLLEAIGGDAIRRAYAASAAYRRHEFGDSHLILR